MGDGAAEDADLKPKCLIADITGLVRGPAGRESRICGMEGSELNERSTRVPILPFRKSCSAFRLDLALNR